MANTIIHDDVGFDILEKGGVLYLRFHDLDNQGETRDTHTFPYDKETAAQIADTIKRKAIGLELATEADMPKPPEGA